MAAGRLGFLQPFDNRQEVGIRIHWQLSFRPDVIVWEKGTTGSIPSKCKANAMTPANFADGCHEKRLSPSSRGLGSTPIGSATKAEHGWPSGSSGSGHDWGTIERAGRRGLWVFVMVGRVGLEPATLCLKAVSSGDAFKK